MVREDILYDFLCKDESHVPLWLNNVRRLPKGRQSWLRFKHLFVENRIQSALEFSRLYAWITNLALLFALKSTVNDVGIFFPKSARINILLILSPISVCILGSCLVNYIVEISTIFVSQWAFWLISIRLFSDINILLFITSQNTMIWRHTECAHNSTRNHRILLFCLSSFSLLW